MNMRLAQPREATADKIRTIFFYAKAAATMNAASTMKNTMIMARGSMAVLPNEKLTDDEERAKDVRIGTRG